MIWLYHSNHPTTSSPAPVGPVCMAAISWQLPAAQWGAAEACTNTKKRFKKKRRPSLVLVHTLAALGAASLVQHVFFLS